jgi:hypothetical protein
MNRTQQTSSGRVNFSHVKQKSNLGKTLVLVLILIALAITSPSQSYADSPAAINSYKLYAHSRIFDFTQFICYVELIDRESHWNAVAYNGNHYGLAQGIYKPLWTMDAYKQIDWSIKYITRRYHNECNALAHSNVWGWY